MKGHPAGSPIPAAVARAPEYANLVLQGGGSLGIAHLGAIAALEERGFRFVGLAGASAGAIVATLMAACRRDVHETCGERLRQVLFELPAADFVDGPASVRRLIKRLVPPRRPTLDDLGLLPGCLHAVRTLSRRMGLNSGNAFSRWFEETLRDRWEVGSVEQLRQRVLAVAHSVPHGNGDGADAEVDWTHYLALTTTALPVGLRMVLPRHLDCFDLGEEGSPADMVRASMSVPGFFEPLTWRLANHGTKLAEHPDFQDLLDPGEGETLDDRETLTLVDGGLLSNFPVDAFTDDFLVPRGRNGGGRTGGDGAEPPPPHPLSRLRTIGIVLTRPHQPSAPARGLRGAIRGASQMVMAARAARDREARVRLLRRKEHDHRLIHVDTGHHNWLDFSLSEEALNDLYQRGREAVEAEHQRKPLRSEEREENDG